MAALIATGIAGALLAGSVAVLVDALDRPLAVAGFTAAMGGVLLYLAFRAARLGRAARAREREQDSTRSDGG